MSKEADLIAQALNTGIRDGLDLMGGADGAALVDLIADYMVNPGSGAQPPESKQQNQPHPSMNNCILGDDEDFSSHHQQWDLEEHSKPKIKGLQKQLVSDTFHSSQ